MMKGGSYGVDQTFSRCGLYPEGIYMINKLSQLAIAEDVPLYLCVEEEALPCYGKRYREGDGYFAKVQLKDGKAVTQFSICDPANREFLAGLARIDSEDWISKALDLCYPILEDGSVGRYSDAETVEAERRLILWIQKVTLPLGFGGMACAGKGLHEELVVFFPFLKCYEVVVIYNLRHLIPPSVKRERERWMRPLCDRSSEEEGEK
jgi:hypothetical protein